MKTNQRQQNKLQKLLLLLSISLLSCCLLSCDNQSAPPQEIDMQQLALDLTTKVQYDDQLALVDNTMLPMIYEMYELPANLQAIVYLGTGATAEEVSVFQAANQEEATQVLHATEQRLNDKKDSLKDYLPAEVQKISQALIVQKNNYVIVCITKDIAVATEIVNAYFK